jgi:regulatory protein YycI of two-component signal transduction system YycFG
VDFKRIEIIFLIVFGCLNIFLFTSYRQNQHVETTVGTQVTEKTSTRQQMKDNQIVVPKLSTKTYEGYYLASPVTSRALEQHSGQLYNQRYSFSGDQLQGHFYQPVTGKNRAALLRNLKIVMKNPHQILYGKEYRYSKAFSTANRLVFTQKMSEGDVFDENGELVFSVSNQRITNYQQTYISKFTTLREKEDTISAKQAVQDLYNDNAITNGATIKWAQLGYSRLLDANEHTVFIPAWFVAMENKSSGNIQIKHVNAFTGAVMKNSDNSSLATSSK